MSETKSIISHKQYLGLSNQGATCYMNSLLQCLFMTKQFRTKLFQWKYDQNLHNNKEDCIPFQLQVLFAKLQTITNKTYVDTTPLINTFGWKAGEMFQQHDVQEFCRVLFDAIEQSGTDQKESQWISDLYEGSTENFIQCKECNSESIKIDNFLDLQLIINNQFENVLNDSIENCLKYHVKSVNLEADNQYYCEKCLKKVNAVKGVRFKQLPQILMLQLNRFELNYTTLQRHKICQRVDFPFVLNMNQFFKKYEDILIQEKEVKPQKQQKQAIKIEKGNTKQGILKKKDSYYEQEYEQQQLQALFDDEPIKEQKIQKKQIQFKESIHPALISRADESYYSCEFNFDTDQSSTIHWGTDVQLQYKNNQKEEIILEKEIEEEKSYENIYKENSTFNLEEKKLIDQYIIQGGYVYELYCVNVHSGGAQEGHYFSYIKSFENNIWYNFNDTNVSIMSPASIEEVYGEINSEKTKNTSAYMLMYKMVQIPAEESQLLPEIPEAVDQIIQAENSIEEERQKKCQQKYEEKLKQITINVYSNLFDCSFVYNKYKSTLNDVKKQVKSYFNIQQDESNYRLRLYSKYDNKFSETFSEDDCSKFLCEISIIQDQSDLVVEYKESHELFEDYDAEKILIFLFVWEKNITFLNQLSSFKIFVKQTQKIQELLPVIAEKLSIDVEKLILIKRKSREIISDQALVLNGNLSQSINELKITNNSCLYVEEKTDVIKWNNEFINDSCLCIIKFNNPNKNKKGEPPEYDNEIVIDNRSSLNLAKQMISQKLDISCSQFIIKKTNSFGAEYRDLSLIINTQNIQNRGTFYIQYGNPSKENEFLIKYFIGGLSLEEQGILQYDTEFLFEMQTYCKMSVIELKEILIQQLKLQKNIEIGNYKRMRLREKNNDQLGNILKDFDHLSSYQFYDKKALCVTLLEEDENLQKDDLLVYVREWNMNICELGQLNEFFIKNDCNIQEFLVQLVQKYTDISIEDIQITKINSSYKFTVEQLILEKEWKSQSDNFTLNLSPWFAQKDGFLFVIRNKLNVANQYFGGKNTQFQNEDKKTTYNTKNEDKVYQTVSFKAPEKALKINIKKLFFLQMNSNQKQKRKEQPKSEEKKEQPTSENQQVENEKDTKIQQNSNMNEKEEQKEDKCENPPVEQKESVNYSVWPKSDNNVKDYEDFGKEFDDDDALQRILLESYKNQ